jgi:hypothetical protein
MFVDDMDLYKEFLKVCLSSVALNMEELVQAASAQNFQIISSLRHSMKPTFQSLELIKLIDALSSLDTSDPDWPEKALRLVPELEEVNHHIQKELDGLH